MIDDFILQKFKVVLEIRCFRNRFQFKFVISHQKSTRKKKKKKKKKKKTNFFSVLRKKYREIEKNRQNLKKLAHDIFMKSERGSKHAMWITAVENRSRFYLAKFMVIMKKVQYFLRALKLNL